MTDAADVPPGAAAPGSGEAGSSRSGLDERQAGATGCPAQALPVAADDEQRRRAALEALTRLGQQLGL